MCIIIDSCRMGDFLNPKHQDSAPIREWLKAGGRMVYSISGGFSDEIGNSPSYKERLTVYSNSGRAHLIPGELFADDEKKLKKIGIRSNDPHVLALARFTRTRLLYTNDPKLIKDFKDRNFLKDPRGKVYKTAKNSDLLTQNTCKKLRTES